jgi:hypothetical protein
MNYDEEGNRPVDWKIVYKTNSPIEAEHFKANLEGANIPVQILSQFDTAMMLTLDELAIVKIFVPETDYIEALAIIRDIENTINTPDDLS